MPASAADDDEGDADETTHDDLTLAGLKRSYVKMSGQLKESKEKAKQLAAQVKTLERSSESKHQASDLRMTTLEDRVQAIEDYYNNEENQQSQPQRAETAPASTRPASSKDAGV